MPDEQLSLNYAYLIEKARSFAPIGGRVLDFGCGTGTLLALASDTAPDLDFWGADTFEGLYSNWKDQVPETVRNRVRLIEKGALPYDDASFDVVISNQVFEHVADAAGALAEVHRVLAPGGYFLSVFPTADTWFEPHCGIYFAHWIKSPVRQERYLAFWRARGFGYYPGDLPPAEWAAISRNTLRTECHYRTERELNRLWRDEFGTKPQSLAGDAMQYRIANHPRFGRYSGIARALQPLLTALYHRRAGVALLARKGDRLPSPS